MCTPGTAGLCFTFKANKMFFKVIILLMTVCGTSIQYRLPKQPMQSYTRLERPLFNRFNFNITPKTTLVPVLFSHNVLNSVPLMSSYMKEIQYAPLHEPRSHKKKHFAQKTRPTHTTMHVSSTTQVTTPAINRKMFNKDHLEPRADSNPGNQNKTIKCPGHKVFATVSRSPGHNAIYRSFSQAPSDQYFNPDMHTHENTKKSVNPLEEEFESVHYMKPEVYQNLEPPSTTKVPFISRMQLLRPVAFIKAKDDLDLINLINLENPKYKRQPQPTYTKFHRVHLNIARIYNPRLLKQKVSPFDT